MSRWNPFTDWGPNWGWPIQPITNWSLLVIGVFGLLAIAENIFGFEFDTSRRFLIAGVLIAACVAWRVHQARRQRSAKMLPKGDGAP